MEIFKAMFFFLAATITLAEGPVYYTSDLSLVITYASLLFFLTYTSFLKKHVEAYGLLCADFVIFGDFFSKKSSITLP